MAEPSVEGPFAEFAEPKKSAVEEYKHSLEHDRMVRQRRRLLLLFLLLGAALGASLGAAYERGLRAQPEALVLALAGGVVGALVGWGVAAATWAMLVFQETTYLADMKPLGADLVRGNQWDKLTVWMAAWASLGIACGAAVGAGEGYALLTQFVWVGKAPPPWQWLGACGGVVLTLGLWTFVGTKRTIAIILGVLIVASVAACLLLAGPVAQ